MTGEDGVTVGYSCLSCGTLADPVYKPIGSRLNVFVLICPHCGLCFSESGPVANNPSVRVSADADWGNVRYGKGFSSVRATELIGAHIASRPEDFNLSQIKVLDVGANRFAFGTAFLNEFPDASMTFVEPDVRLRRDARLMRETIKKQTQKHLEETLEFIWKRIEETALDSSQFDVIHLSHTLEHLSNPKQILDYLRGLLKERGVMYVEVPDIAFVGTPDIVEEFFIDKHTVHFSSATLQEMLTSTGWKFVTSGPYESTPNLYGLLEKAPVETSVVCGGENRVDETKQLIAGYHARLAENRLAVRTILRDLTQECANLKCLVWGAGRIFEVFRSQGLLDTLNVVWIVDEYLPSEVLQRETHSIVRSDEVQATEVEVVIISIREGEEEVVRLARSKFPKAKVISLVDLLRR